MLTRQANTHPDFPLLSTLHRPTPELLHLLLSTSTGLQVDAVQMVTMTTGAGETKYPIKAINILKVITPFPH